MLPKVGVLVYKGLQVIRVQEYKSVRYLRTDLFRIRFKEQWSAGKCYTRSTASSNINKSLKFMAAPQNVT